MKLKEIADKLGARLDPPDADVEITSVGSIESALSRPDYLCRQIRNMLRWPGPPAPLP